MKFPEIVIVGATKCGTTALWYNLDKHPDIHMATKSSTSVEMNYWAGRMRRKGREWYKSKFPNDKICGEKTAGYFVKKRAFQLMKENIPHVKLFFCIRNPVDRAYSNFQMNKKAGKVATFNYQIFRKRYAPQGRYIKYIKGNMIPFFDKESIHICIAEKMKSNLTEEMTKVFDFVGVEDLNYPMKKIHGVLLKDRSRQEDIALSRSEKFYRVWSKHTDRISGPIRKQMLEYYKPFNEELFDYLGYEIKEWNK